MLTRSTSARRARTVTTVLLALAALLLAPLALATPAQAVGGQPDSNTSYVPTITTAQVVSSYTDASGAQQSITFNHPGMLMDKT